MENKETMATEEKLQEVLNKIKSIIIDELGCTEEEISLDAKWNDDLMADSLDMAYIMQYVEELFGIYIEDDGMWKPTCTLRETCESISRCLE